MAGKGLSQSAYDIILDRIVSNKYPPGSMLNEIGLQQELNISRTPIHAAMLLLQKEHLVEIRPKKGIRVTDITAQLIGDIYNIRELFELDALRRYGSNFSKEKLLNYHSIFSAQYAREFDHMFEKDVQFHMEIVTLSGNALLIEYYSMLRHQFVRLSNISGHNNAARVESSNKEHLKVIECMIQDDEEGAAQAMAAHLQKARETAYRVVILHNGQPVDEDS